MMLSRSTNTCLSKVFNSICTKNISVSRVPHLTYTQSQYIRHHTPHKTSQSSHASSSEPLVAAGSAELIVAGGSTEVVGSATGVEAGGSMEEVVSTPASALVATGSDAAVVSTGSALEVVATGSALEVATVLPLGAAAAGWLASSALVHPVFFVIAAGQATCSKDTVGLSAPSNHPNRKLQPAWRASGKVEQSVAEETPPY